ncbi:TonB-dependent siderophore receptor [Pseudomonas sp. PDM16]|uniref:TonB-dependent siderophore receptor n=1 Tax=Pseudomonas sp. PDM16 TaxID=2769292 RepID=UPI001CE03358|nr:TonB-dependent siderophore receptor [Pseudomonas sp. PDM16]
MSAGLLLTSGLAHAEELHQYTLPSAPLDATLGQIARDAGLILVIQPSQVAQAIAQPVQGRFTAERALQEALRGQPLQLQRNADGSYHLVEVKEGALNLSPLDINAHAASLDTSNGYVPLRISSASKTDTDVLELPQSVSVITRDQMNDQQVQSVTEALRYVPGVKVETYGMDPKGYDWVFIRGFNAQATSDFRDGLRQQSNSYSFFRTDPYALERVDILRGPGSTLFGAGEAGGLINRISKKPLAEGVHQVELQYGSFDRVLGQFDVGGRLDADGSMLYRLVGVARDSNTQHDYGSSHEVADDHLYLAPSLTWAPSEDTRLTLLADLLRDRSGGTVSPYTEHLAPTDTLLNDYEFNHFDQDQYSVGYQFEHRISDSLQFRQNLRQGQVDVKMNNMLPLGRVSDLVPALAGTPAGNLVARQPRRWDEHLNALAVDNQLQYDLITGDVQQTLLSGIDYARAHADVRRYYSDLTLPALLPYLFDPEMPRYGIDVPRPTTPKINYRETTEQIGYYLQDQLHLGERWIVTAGGRYDDYRLEHQDQLAASHKLTEHAFTGKLGVVYKTDFGLAPYISYSESFLPNSGIARDGGSFEPSEAKQWEAGIKYQPHDDLLLTAAAFEIIKSNVLTTDPLDRTFSVAQGEVRSRGIELEARARLSEAWDLLASYTRTDTEITKSNGGDKGNETPNVPKNMASAWISYSFHDGALQGLSLGGGARYIGEMYGDTANQVRVSSYTLVDAGAHYRLTPQIIVALNAQNLFDREYTSTCYGDEVDGCFAGVERTLIGSVKYDW